MTDEIKLAGQWLADNQFRMTQIYNVVNDDGSKAPEGIKGFLTGWLACTENAAATQWVSVEDRLPEDGQTVIASHKNGITEAYYTKDRKFHEPYYGQTCGDYFDSVTYWSPLPEPPEKKEDGDG